MTKDEYKIYAENLVQDVSNRIDELKQRSTGIDEKKKAHFDEQVGRLTQLRDDLNHKLEEFEEVPESNWEGAKTDFKMAIEHLKKGFESLFSILSE